MAPPSSSALKPKSGTPRRSVKPDPRQRTLDMFMNRGSSILPPASAPTAPPKKTSSAQPTLNATRSTFAVVLTSTPSKHTETAAARTVDDDADDLMIMSDLTPQFRRLAAQAASGTSLAKPALPAAVVAADEAEATSSGATPQPQPKKRGRPKGFRPNAAKKASQDDESEQPGRRRLRPDRPKAGSMYAGKGKRRGRPPKQASPKPREIYENLNPHFNAWICEWQGCKAELHNFATLRRHVAVVHLKNIPLQCRWGKCAAQQSPHEFPTSADLEFHMEDRHMPPIAWQAGDGPQVSLKRYAPDDGTELPDYLFDKAGNQITPSIRDQKEEDFLTWRANRRKLKDLLLLRDQNLPSEEEDEGMDVVESG